MSGYTIAEYIRLSNEDGDLKKSGKLESNSIINQRDLLNDYISRQPDLAGARVVEFCDDGWSGKNFDRPGVKELLQQIREGKIQCIIVKDLSRFGRDYLMVGNYISRVFPFLGVRFIAVNDEFDSIRPMDIDSLETSFKALLYDIYSRDLSRKVRSGKKNKAEHGAFLSPYAPYGFIKDPEDKHHLLIDPEAAKTVRRIFRSAIDGLSTIKIAQMLNDEMIPTPMIYKRTAGCSRTVWPCVREENFWTPHSILKILRDERYIGKVVFGKRNRDIVGSSHTVRVNRSEWVVVGDAHESIVTYDEFDLAQARIKKREEHAAASIDNRPLYKKVRCGVCGHLLNRHKAKQPYYLCKTPSISSAYACPKEKLLEADLMDTLLADLRVQAMYAVELGRIWEEQRRQKSKKIDAYWKSLAALKGNRDRMEQHIKRLYEDFALGTISQAEYLAEKANVVKERDTLVKQIAELEDQLESIDREGKLHNRFVDSFRKYVAVQEMTAQIISEVLQEVIVYPGCSIQIVWNFREDFQNLLITTNTETR